MFRRALLRAFVSIVCVCGAATVASAQDSDSDGVVDATDNCPTVPNPSQGDCDGDGVGDACETGSDAQDCDSNGELDSCEIVADPLRDSNQNGVLDVCEGPLLVLRRSAGAQPPGPGSIIDVQAVGLNLSPNAVGLQLYVEWDIYDMSYVNASGGDNGFNLLAPPVVETVAGSPSLRRLRMTTGQFIGSGVSSGILSRIRFQLTSNVSLCETISLLRFAPPSATVQLGTTVTGSGGVALPFTPVEAVLVSLQSFETSALSPPLVPYSFSNPRTWLLDGVRPGSQGATLTVTARGQLGSLTRFLTVKADGLTLASNLFGAGSGASMCSATASSAELTIPAAAFAAMTADGQMEVRIEPSLNATSEGCPSATLQVRLDYTRDIIDCNADGVDDLCALQVDPDEFDCNGNEALDSCEIASGSVDDVNGNGRPDECEVDCNGNELPDIYEIAQGLAPDCNQNAVPDSCDIAAGGSSSDVDRNGVPDDCKADCNNNSLPDAYEIAQGLLSDCDSNAVPDSCQIASNSQLDCDNNQQLDSCQIATDPSLDCDQSGLVDTCQIAANPLLDCNEDGVLDLCQGGPNGFDCDGNGVPDSCDIANGAEDKNNNGRLDLCELRFGDLNLDGQINGSDLAGLLAVWGLPDPPYGDLNGDGQVGGTDLAFLLARWGPVP